MTEVFFDIDHLSSGQLRELFADYRPQGWVDFEYERLMPEGVRPPELTDAVIAANIDAGNPHNYCVLMQDCEDEPDGIMIGFGLRDYPDFNAYLHLGVNLLTEITEKYGLHVSRKPLQVPPPPGLEDQSAN